MEILKTHLKKLIETLSKRDKSILKNRLDTLIYSKGQHRGNVGEGQLHLNHDNIKKFQKYLCRSNELLNKIRIAYKRQVAKKQV